MKGKVGRNGDIPDRETVGGTYVGSGRIGGSKDD
jgi:hypothetical protein